MTKEELIELIKRKYERSLELINYYTNELEIYPVLRTSGYSEDELRYQVKKYKIITKVYFELLLESGTELDEFNYLVKALEKHNEKNND